METSLTESHYYQDPPERRAGGRERLSDENQLLVNILDKRIANRCKDECVIPKGFHPAVPHAVNKLAEIGEGNYDKAIDEIGDQHKEVREGLQWWTSVKKTVMFVVVTAIVSTMIGALVWGLRAQMMKGM